MAYDPSDGGHLYVLDSNPDQIVEINTASGEIVSQTNVPVAFPGVNAGGLTIDPVTGNFWVGGHNGEGILEVATDGTLVRILDVNGQGITNELTGLDFNAAGNLLVSSTYGVVYEVAIAAPPPPPAIVDDYFSTTGVPEMELEISINDFTSDTYEDLTLDDVALEVFDNALEDDLVDSL